MKWYWKIFPWLMFDHYKKESEKLVSEQKAIAAKVVDEANKKLAEIKKGNFLIQPSHATEYAFTCGGEDYFKFVDETDMPADRAMSAMDVYSQLEQKTDFNYHKLSYQAIYDQALKGNLIKVGQIAENSLQRINHITNADIIMQLAAVLYFDRHENPYEYNYEYAEKKIALWRKEGLEPFFTRTPLKEYLPSFGSLSMNFQTYTDLQRKELLQHLTSHLLLLSGDPKNSDIKTSISSEIKKLNQLIHSKD